MVFPDSIVSKPAYAIDSVNGGILLPDITQACLDHLMKWSPDKFFMMVEGGDIDHAAHSQDGGTVIKDIISFNEALEIAYKFYLQHPDETLIVDNSRPRYRWSQHRKLVSKLRFPSALY